MAMANIDILCYKFRHPDSFYTKEETMFRRLLPCLGACLSFFLIAGTVPAAAGEPDGEVTEAPESDSRLLGVWRGPDGSIIEFGPNGKGSNQRGAFNYEAGGGFLVFSDGISTIVVAYRIDGGNLAVTSNAGNATFVRVTEDKPTAGKKAVAAGVIVNRVKLTAEQVRKLEVQFHVRMINGTYWYDAKCGAWGMDGGPCLGFVPAKLQVGGALPANASGGGTGVFINGRELHPLDVGALQTITPVLPGRYWVDEFGNCGYEGNPTALLNLVQLASAARARSGGSYHSRSDITGIGSGGDGKTSYVMGKDWSVIIGE
jgi:hypothetical protein